MTLTKMELLSRGEQRAALTSVLGDEWTRILRYGISVAEDADLATVLDAMGAPLRNQRNIIMDRRDFHSRIQEPYESFDDFLCAVKELDNFCEFCDTCVDEQLRDRIVVGTSDEVALKRLLENKTLTLQSARDICRASESVNKCSGVLKGAASRALNNISNFKRARKPDNKNVKLTQCFRYGKDCRRDGQRCPAINKICRHCGTIGQLAKVCKQMMKGAGKDFSKQPVNRCNQMKRGDSINVYQLLAGVLYTQSK